MESAEEQIATKIGVSRVLIVDVARGGAAAKPTGDIAETIEQFACHLLSEIPRGDLILIALVGGDNLLHQMVSGNILFGKVDEAVAVLALENPKSFLQS